ncbi:MAG: hypothetical protein AAF636_25125 [Pseudomonadota bacterium]
MVVKMPSGAINLLNSLDITTRAYPDTLSGPMDAASQMNLAVNDLTTAIVKDLKPDEIFRSIFPVATKKPMTKVGTSGLQRALLGIAPIIFYPAEQPVAQGIRASAPDAFTGQPAIFIANLKEKKMTPTGTTLNSHRAPFVGLSEIGATP